MDFPTLLQRYFGTPDLEAVDAAALADGAARMRVDFGLETDKGRRFALWTLMHMLGVAPDIDVAFKDAAEQEAARNFMDIAASLEEPKDG
ncbi:hypothetical protein C1T17_00140 [Sphingobium sp. SCG-1]|uniref:hypothetical protein n=1 Tax=Sphingobium sp. SCG-1 TaxID=2072936 RepID=UPI000CD684BA|nr:hypothetical protein [Sphingobium sp. SCG-1]AUW56725.1 hypothetical protein C1T17_00140 [Sphingobium sp. SCG-1]